MWVNSEGAECSHFEQANVVTNNARLQSKIFCTVTFSDESTVIQFWGAQLSLFN